MSMQGGTIDLADLVAKLGGGLAIGGKGKARSEKKKVKVKDVSIRLAGSHGCKLSTWLVLFTSSVAVCYSCWMHCRFAQGCVQLRSGAVSTHVLPLMMSPLQAWAVLTEVETERKLATVDLRKEAIE